MEIHEYQTAPAAYLGGYDKGYTEGYNRGYTQAIFMMVKSIRELSEQPGALREEARIMEKIAKNIITANGKE